MKKDKKEISVERPEKLAERVFEEIVERKAEEKEVLRGAGRFFCGESG